MSVTIKQLASELGIAPSTVSRALRDDHTISAGTKKLVKQLAQKKNYKPNPFALMLRNQRSGIIAVLVPKLNHHFFAGAIAGIETEAQKHDYQIVVCQSEDAIAKEQQVLNSGLIKRVDGMIVAHSKETIDFEHFERLSQGNMPMVFFDRVCMTMKASNVITDDFTGVREATLHLLEEGCRNLVYLGVEDDLLLNEIREDGFLDIMRNTPAHTHRYQVVKCATNLVEESKAKVIELFKQGSCKQPDGIIANDDFMALGALEAAKEMGIRVPQDLAIVGFGDAPFAKWVTPSLSTIKQPSLQAGTMAAQLLFEEIDSGVNEIASKKSKILDTHLLIRDSSKR